jgi:ABC-type multidrug transport system ATPase subunit
VCVSINMTDIAVQELWYFVEDSEGKQKCLLSNISTTFLSSVVTVLMGHSGAGYQICLLTLHCHLMKYRKTTLMDLVAGRKKDGFMSGSILFNGESVNADIAYVQSSDIHIGEFTVYDNLYYAARLRLGNSITETECRQRCSGVAHSVSLDQAMHVLVGSALTKGISGGQKKRLSIAIELLALPSILCLDEPTTGK